MALNDRALEASGSGLKIKYPDKTVAGGMGSRVVGRLFKRDALTAFAMAVLPRSDRPTKSQDSEFRDLSAGGAQP